MSEHNDTEPECVGESYLTPWEKKCLEDWEKEAMLEERLQAENERSSQKMWQSFQNSATAVSRLFKGLKHLLCFLLTGLRKNS